MEEIESEINWLKRHIKNLKQERSLAKKTNNKIADAKIEVYNMWLVLLFLRLKEIQSFEEEEK